MLREGGGLRLLLANRGESNSLALSTEHSATMMHRTENKQATNREQIGGGLFDARSEGDATKPQLHYPLTG